MNKCLRILEKIRPLTANRRGFMTNSENYKFEQFEEYYGNVRQVKEIIDRCKICGSDVVHSHISDYSHMLIQESSRCPDCGCDQNKKVHVIM